MPTTAPLRSVLCATAFGCCLLVASCGGGSSRVDPAEVPVSGQPADGGGGGGGVVATAPVISQQPAALSVAEGQAASFSVAATGTAPLAYQWQRNGTAIAGATSARYSLPAAAASDNGALFRAVVSNAAGNATSDNAALTVTVAATVPTLSVASQPASTSVTAGTAASFAVTGSCSASTFTVQWQRAGGGGFVDIPGATAATYTMTPATTDNGAQFRAVMSCGGQAVATSNVAVLGVTAVAVNVLAAVPVTPGRDLAAIWLPNSIVKEPSGSFAFINGLTIRRLSADLSTITVIAGSSTSTGSVDGVGTAAQFSEMSGLTIDTAGNLYVTEPFTELIRRIATDGTVTTIAGSRNAMGNTDGVGAAARFFYPMNIAMGPDGDLYVVESGNCLIRRVTVAGSVSTYAGDRTGCGYVDGAAIGARFNTPFGIAVAGDGTVYVADTGNTRIRRIQRNANAAGAVDTLAGNGIAASTLDGIGAGAGLNNPHGLAIDGNTLYVRDSDNYSGLIRAINLTTAAVRTFAGTRGTNPTGNLDGLVDGPPGTAFLSAGDNGVAPVGDGRVVFTDIRSMSVRVASAAGYVTTIAHDASFGDTHPDGSGVLAQLSLRLVTQASVAAAPDGSIVVGQPTYLRRLAADGTVSPIAGIPGYGANLDGSNSIGQFLNAYRALAVGADGTIFVADDYNIRRVDAATNTVVSLAGSRTLQGAVDGQGAAARFGIVQGLAVDAGGNVFAADIFNSAIRRIDAAGNVTTFAGLLGIAGTADGAAGTARFTQPRSMAFAPDGSLWVVDDQSPYAVLRRIAPDGTVTTVATSGAFLNRGSTDVAVDPAGNVYLSTASGLASLASATGVLTTAIPIGSSGLVLGNSPQLAGASSSLVAAGVKQLLMISDSTLLRATLP